MDKIKVVIFDLDGVLVDATEWHYVALNRALALFGYSISRYEHVVAYNGLPTKKKLEMLSAEKGLPVGLHGLINRIKQVYTREEILTKCKPSFQKQYMLSRLSREGLRLAVCSNAIRASVMMMLQQSGIDEYFEFVIGNEEVHKAKPDPEIYLHAFMRLGCQPAEIVIVEDAPHGVEAARRSGAWVCQVNGFQDVEYFMLKRFLKLCDPNREPV
jgi:HAD superfamily hydrolase (TIGR01509 family)